MPPNVLSTQCITILAISGEKSNLVLPSYTGQK
jgi:hypothetical protein